MLAESCIGLTREQSRVVDIFYTSMEPIIAEFKLMEATLTPDQIQQMFGDIEQTATASGKNRTVVGKGVDAAKLPGKVLKAIDSKINELGRMAQEAGPIKKMDAKFEDLKKKISTDNPEVAKRVKAVSDWAKANPGKASLAVGILTAAAAFAGGPAGGAAAGFFLRSANELLKGEKLSTAAGKSLKTAAYGALAGMAINYLSDAIIDNIALDATKAGEAMEKAFNQQNLQQARDALGQEFNLDPSIQFDVTTVEMAGQANNYFFSYDLALTPEQSEIYKSLQDAITSAESFSDEKFQAMVRFHEFLQPLQNNPENLQLKAFIDGLRNIPEDIITGKQLGDILEMHKSADELIAAVSDVAEPAAAAIQGALQTVESNNKSEAKPVDPEEKEEAKEKLGDEEGDSKKESIAPKGKKLSEGQVYYVFNQIDQYTTLMEAPKTKQEPAQQAEPDVGSEKQKKPGMLARMGKNLTTKVTADKLNKAWKKAGSPTDSAELAKFLQTQGVGSETIAPVYKNMKLPVPKMQTPAEKGKTQQKTAQTGDAKGTTAQGQDSTGATQQGGPKTAPTSKARAGGTAKTAPAGAGTKSTGSPYAQIKALTKQMTKKQKQQFVAVLRKDLGIA